MNELLDGILNAVQSVDPVLRTLLAGVAIMLETSVLIGLVVPGDTVVIVAATGIEDAVQYVALVIAVLLGALAGESIGFAIGRWFGPRIRESALGRRIGESTWAKAEGYVRRRGGPAVFLSRFLPVLHSLVPLTVGMSGMRYRRFLAWTAPASLIWALAYGSVGWFAADSYRELSRELHWAGYLFVGVIAVFLVLVWLAKRVLLRVERRHLDATGEAGAMIRADAAADRARDAASAAGPDATAEVERGGTEPVPPRTRAVEAD